MRGKLTALVACAATLNAGPAAADHNRAVPPGLDASVAGPHFVLHYDAAAVSQQYAEDGLADFEESYSRLISGGGATPNAGLEAPTADADGKTDVYLSAPSKNPGFFGGTLASKTFKSAKRVRDGACAA